MPNSQFTTPSTSSTEPTVSKPVLAEPILSDPVLFDTSGAQRSYRLAEIRQSLQTPASAFSLDRCLPVRGRAQGGDEGNVSIEEHPIDWTFRPADLQGVNDAFAVFVSGDSMAPKYKNGDLVYVHPTRSLIKKRFVLVETTEHKGFIKQFISWQDDMLIVQQFNPELEIQIPRETILRVMLVIGSLDC